MTPSKRDWSSPRVPPNRPPAAILVDDYQELHWHEKLYGKNAFDNNQVAQLAVDVSWLAMDASIVVLAQSSSSGQMQETHRHGVIHVPVDNYNAVELISQVQKYLPADTCQLGESGGGT